MENNENKVLIETDFLNMEYDYVEYYVGMAKMVVYWHVRALGFKVVAYAGPETGVQDKFSYLIVKNDIKLLITSASTPSSYKIVSFVDLHGNGIKKIAVRVSDVETFYNDALKNGAIPMQYPERLTDSKGFVDQASIKLFDDNEIVMINYDNYNGPFIPGYMEVEEDEIANSVDSELCKIDHIACALRINEISLWEKYVNGVFKSTTVSQFDERHVPGEKKIGMLLKVLQSDNKKLNNVLVEPDKVKRTQVQLFIDENYGAGIQHIAFSSNNIFKSVEMLRKNGVVFTKTPDTYYRKLAEKYPDLDVELLKKHGVLCDVLDGALLFQIFTAPLGDRSTLFYEIIQRVNQYNGFGLDNIHALFEALELEITLKKNLAAKE